MLHEEFLIAKLIADFTIYRCVSTYFIRLVMRLL